MAKSYSLWWPKPPVMLSVAQRSTAESLRHARYDLHRTVQELKRTNQALQAENAERQQAEEALRQHCTNTLIKSQGNLNASLSVMRYSICR